MKYNNHIDYDLTKDFADWKRNGDVGRTKIQIGVLKLWEVLLFEIKEDRIQLFDACDKLEEIVINCR